MENVSINLVQARRTQNDKIVSPIVETVRSQIPLIEEIRLGQMGHGELVSQLLLQHVLPDIA
jgi:hypothetical protein